MALSSNTVLEVRNAGSDTNGGGFVSDAAGNDRSQQDAAFVSGTNLTVHASVNTDVLPDGHTPGSADVGNLVNVSNGAGFTTGIYQIVSIQSGYWRLDRSPAATGTASGVWAMGGALATAAKANATHTTSNVIWFRSGSTYSLTGNALSWTADRIAGYATAREDDGIATFDASGMTASQNTFANARDHVLWNNLQINNSRGIPFANTSGQSTGYRLVALSAVSHGIALTRVSRSVAVSCGGSGFSTSNAIGCVSVSNGSHGFGYGGSNSQYTQCVSSHNGGIGFYGGEMCQFSNLIAYFNTSHGISASRSASMQNIVTCRNGGWGINGSTQQSIQSVGFGTGAMANTSGTYSAASSNKSVRFNNVSFSANPFIDPDNATIALRNFGLNTDAAGGALLRGLGFPGVWDYLTGTIGYLDIGAVQHQDSPATNINIIHKFKKIR